jgi:RNA polymerase sigma-70 factor, ECF subfamily
MSSDAAAVYLLERLKTALEMRASAHGISECSKAAAEPGGEQIKGPATTIAEAPHLSDERLMEQVQQGTQEALALLFRRHGRTVFNVAWRILRDHSEADDLRQEVFLYIFERARLFDFRKGSAAAWIMQVTYHRAIDRRRYLACRQHYDACKFDEQQVPAGIAPMSTDVIDGKAILSRLRSTLSPEQRETLELHLFEGYSLREIAEKSGQSVGNVRHHYYRAVERLRSHIFPRSRT